jgi:hypothetical protein
MEPNNFTYLNELGVVLLFKIGRSECASFDESKLYIFDYS